MTTSDHQDLDIDRPMFFKLAEPIKDYCISGGISDINAAMLAATIVEKQIPAIKSLFQSELSKRVREARIETLKWAIAPDGVANLYERVNNEINTLNNKKEIE